MKFEVVLPNGAIVNANQFSNIGLWIALKGGSGSNFGIVTRIDMKSLKQGKVRAGEVTTPEGTAIFMLLFTCLEFLIMRSWASANYTW